MNPKYSENSFEALLKNALTQAQGHDIDVRTLIQSLSGRSYPALLVLIGLPFCFPLQIPGFSTPFGLLLAYFGLRIACNKKMHCPDFLNRTISYETFEKLVNGTLKVMEKTKPFLKQRLTFLTSNSSLHALHGLFVFLLGVTLALPLPIPLTNILVATPIVALGLGLLEDDGLFVMIGYFLTIVAVGFFGSILWLGLGIIQGKISFFS